MRRIVSNVLLGLLLVLMSVSALAGIAAAVWSAVGSGSGSAAAGTTVAVSLSPGSPTTLIAPGGSADVVVTVANSNSAPVRIGSLALDPARGSAGFAVDAAHSGCALSTLSFVRQTSGWTVPAKSGTVNGTLTVTLTNALTMGIAAANACQGATFTVYLTGAP